MVAFTDEDITNITNIVTQNAQKDDAKIRQFSGLQKEAVSWMEDYDYIALSNDWNDEKKIRKLGAYLTGSGREWYSLCIQNQNNLTWANVKTAFYKQFLPVDYETHLREIFRTRKQKLFEPSANYVVAMRSVLAKSGQTMTEKEAVEFILTNMLPDIRKELLLRKPKTYAGLMEAANTIEFALKSSQEPADEDIKSVVKQLASVSLDSRSSGQQVNAIQQNYGGRGFNRGNRGYYNFVSRNKRGAFRCYACDKIGHMAANCRSNMTLYANVRGQGNNRRGRGNWRGRNRGGRWRGNRGRGRGQWNNGQYGQNNQYGNNSYGQNMNAIGYDQPSSQLALPEPNQNIEMLNVIGVVGVQNGFYTDLYINGWKAKALVDSGAAACFISKDFAESIVLKLNPFEGRPYHLADGKKVKPNGQAIVKLALTLNGETKRANVNMFVLDGLTHTVVLGANAIRSFGIVINGQDNTLSF